MKSIQIICFFVCLFIGQACKQNTTAQQDETPANTKDTLETGNNSTVTGGHDQTFLTSQLFHFKASNTVGKDAKENPYANQWIDMEPNGMYKAGTLKEQTHTGRWDYNPQSKVLLLRPDDSNFKESEWSVMHNNDMMVWVGTQTYKNNATQIQLKRSTELPQ